MKFRNPIYNRLGMVKRFVATPIPRPRYRGRVITGPPTYCAEAGEEIAFIDCLTCSKFAVWKPQDGDLKRCFYEFKNLASRGYYDGTWDDHPENFDPETFAEIQARKKLNAEFEADFEREKRELACLADELEKRSYDDRFDDFCWLNDDYEDEEEDEESAQDDEDEDEF